VATIKDELWTHVTTADSFAALASTRLYPFGGAPASATKPYATFGKIGGFRHHHLGGSAGLVEARFQFDCYAGSAKAAEGLADAVRDALDGYIGTISTVEVLASFLVHETDDFFSPVDSGSVREHRTIVEFDIWYRESIPTLT
jgi:hypothetical protein